MSITRTYRSGSQVATFAVARQNTRLSRVYGYFNANSSPAQFWLQFFTTTLNNDGTVAAPTAAQVPLESFLMVNNYEFAELFNSGLTLIPGPVYCALSSTEVTYTAVVGGQVADIYIEAEEWEIEPPTLTTESIASGNAITVWTDTIAAPSAPNALYDIIAADLNNSSGAQLYLQMFCGSTVPVNGATAFRQWEIPIAGTVGSNINCNGTILLNFGDPEKGGWVPLSNSGGQLSSINPLKVTNGAPSVTANAGVGNATSAVYLAISTTTQTLTLGAANAAKITARYCVSV